METILLLQHDEAICFTTSLHFIYTGRRLEQHKAMRNALEMS